MDEAPLIGTAGAPVPAGAWAFWYAGAGGARIRAAIVPADGVPRGSVVVSPGRTESIEKYFEVAGDLAAKGYFVLIHDWRGQGLSHRALLDRLKGHADGHADFLMDFDLLLVAVESFLPQPWIALGHSMGGALTALALAEGEERFAAALLTAPMLGLAAVRQLPQAALLTARLAARLGRGGDYIAKASFEPMLGEFERNILTHDRARYERYRAQLRARPDLALGGVTWGWLVFALEAASILARPSAARSVRLPLTVVAAGEDRLVLNAAARRFAEAAPQGRYVEIAGAYHEVLMETDERRAQVWAEFDAVVERIRPPRA